LFKFSPYSVEGYKPSRRESTMENDAAVLGPGEDELNGLFFLKPLRPE
jgi:hypothetical protein